MMKDYKKTFWILAMMILLLGITNIAQAEPSIELKKYTNGLHINSPTGPEIQVGDEVVWQYVVTNTGDTTLSDISVTDSDPEVMVTCPANTLLSGESMICEGTGTAEATAPDEPYQNTGYVNAVDPDDPGGTPVTDDNVSSYTGVNAETNGDTDEDTDGDEISDDDDQCPNSNVDTTVVIAGCDSSVSNVLFDTGCTMNDLIAQCADDAKNHGKFVSCVAKLTNYWKKHKLIKVKEKGSVQSCAAKSDIP
jgi:uncharacterized repeat protein (TIGR01451 family)